MDTVKSESNGGFPHTYWSRLAAVKSGPSTEREEAFNFLAQRYWKLVYLYVRQCGHNQEEAEDLVQEFFLAALDNELSTWPTASSRHGVLINDCYARKSGFMRVQMKKWPRKIQDLWRFMVE